MIEIESLDAQSIRAIGMLLFGLAALLREIRLSGGVAVSLQKILKLLQKIRDTLREIRDTLREIILIAFSVAAFFYLFV